MIHSTSIIDKKCKIGNNVQIGPYSVIGPNVEIGDNTIIQSHVNISGNTIIGNGNKIYPFVSINDPQDLKFNGEPTNLIIGDNVMIGGQAGISGHLKIGNNVLIGGGSGVIRDIPDNNKVMGYPSKDLRKFLKENK